MPPPTNITADLTQGFISINPPSPVQPVYPNFAQCDSYYGQFLSYNHANFAAAKLPFGGSLVAYVPNDQSASHHLPFTTSSDLVSVQVDYASAFMIDSVPSILLRPNDIRGMAGYVIQECIKDRGVAGFATAKISSLLDFVNQPDTDITRVPYPPQTMFMTVTVGSKLRYMPPPGNYDPAIAQALEASALRDAQHIGLPGAARELRRRARAWARQQVSMRPLLKAWWDFLKPYPIESSSAENRTLPLTYDGVNVTMSPNSIPSRSRGDVAGVANS